MIKFFRKIRHQLLTENKLGKYLIYALGEIILVVIGILIALQINNWNVDWIDRQSEVKYYRGIIKNLNSDIVQLSRLLQNDTTQLEAYVRIQRAFLDEKLLNDENALKMDLLVSHASYDFIGQNNFFDQMKSSGKLNLIQSDSALAMIQNYYALSLSVEEIVKNNNQLHAKYLQIGVFPYIDGNSMAQAMYPKQYQFELNEFDISFFKRDISSHEVQRFVYSIDYMKGATLINLNNRKRLLVDARSTKSYLEALLESYH